MGNLIDQFFGTCDRWVHAFAPPRYVGGRWFELAAVAASFTCAILLIMRYSVPRSGVRDARRRMLADTYELLVYWRSPRAVFRAEGKLIYHNLALVVLLLPTLAFGGLLFAAAYRTLDERYAHAPLRPGTVVVVRTRFVGTDSSRWVPRDGDLRPVGTDLRVTGRTRTRERQIVWTRLHCSGPGLTSASTGADGAGRIVLNVGMSDAPVAAWQRAGDLTVYVPYPRERTWGVRGYPGMWLGWFFFFSALAAVPIARVLRVKL